MAALRDIVYSASPKIVARTADGAVTAGDCVYLTGDKTSAIVTNASAGFDGIAMATVVDGKEFAVAIPPTECYVNTSETVTANDYVMCDCSSSGYVQKFAVTDDNAIICGLVTKGATAAGIARITLMNVYNVST